MPVVVGVDAVYGLEEPRTHPWTDRVLVDQHDEHLGEVVVGLEVARRREHRGREAVG